jgi:hypothetical protein
MLQRINRKYSAVLLLIPPVSTDGGAPPAAWDTKFDDPKRQAYHQRKMESKVLRPAAQLKYYGLDPGTVLHEVDRPMSLQTDWKYSGLW